MGNGTETQEQWVKRTAQILREGIVTTKRGNDMERLVLRGHGDSAGSLTIGPEEKKIPAITVQMDRLDREINRLGEIVELVEVALDRVLSPAPETVPAEAVQQHNPGGCHLAEELFAFEMRLHDIYGALKGLVQRVEL